MIFGVGEMFIIFNGEISLAREIRNPDYPLGSAQGLFSSGKGQAA
jgi:hypothetical protein